MDFTELKYNFDQIFQIWLNEKLLKAQMYEENIMLTYLQLMIEELSNKEILK